MDLLEHAGRDLRELAVGFIRCIRISIEEAQVYPTAVFVNPKMLHKLMLAVLMDDDTDRFEVTQDNKGNVTFKKIRLIPEKRLTYGSLQIAFKKDPVFDPGVT